MNLPVEEIKTLISNKDYETAFAIGAECLEKLPNNLEIIAVLMELTAALREEGWKMDNKKADGTPEAIKIAKLLDRVNLLTKQDVYGRKISSDNRFLNYL